MRIFDRLLVTTSIASGIFAATPVCAQSSASAGSATAAQEVPEIVVTGVFNAKAIEDAPIAITAVTAAEIGQQVPASAADLLKNVPGVFVNSSLGEIRNVVFSRGVSANSLDGAGGYYYVSLQEDGLPVEAVTSNNFGPDYFARTDIMLNRLEALRGGTSTVTGANAPGGIFNYISRTGKSHPGYEIQAKFGLEGDGRNPYYRGDFYAGGNLGSPDLYYAIGGFYRASRGARDPGYNLNEGGQVRANLLWDYGAGSLRFDAKYLNDRNGWFEFLPANNFSDPKIAPAFSNYSSVLPPKGRFGFTNPDGSTGSYDPSNLVKSKSIAFGATWEHDFSDVFRLQNRMRYTENTTTWNTGAAIFALGLDDFFVGAFGGSVGIPGTITYRNASDGSIAAQVVSVTGFDRTVTVNNLPNQGILANGILTQFALAQRYKSKEFQNQLTLGAELGGHQLALGGYISLNKLSNASGSGGFGVSTLSSQPTMLTATIDTGAGILQLTNPNGFGSLANSLFSGDGYSGEQNQISLYAGDNWQINDQLSIDVGIRYENLKYDITSLTLGAAAPYGVAGGGADGDPLTLYDNFRNTYGAPVRVKREYNLVNYTGAVNYKFNDAFQVYARYTKGRKAPDFEVIRNIDDAGEVANIFPKAQTIEQIEIGLKYNRDDVRVGLYPFYSKLSDVADQQTFVDDSLVVYSPVPQFGRIKTIGIEFNADVDFAERFNFRTAITLQNPKASGFGTWVQNTPIRSDDVLVTTPKGDADNNPKFMTRSTLTANATDALHIFITHSYLGKRAANRNNAWYMPGFHTVDIGAAYDISENFKLQANVNNVFNSFGVLSWARGGGLFNSLDRQGLTRNDIAANPGQLFSVLPAQPRSFWVTATAKF